MKTLRILSLLSLLTAVISGSGRAETSSAGPWIIAHYGDSTPPVLHCNPLAACLVSLEPGETVGTTILADTAAWDLKITQAGPGNEVALVALKPHRCGTTTNLYIATDRRLYTVLLDSPECGDPTRVTATAGSFTQLRYDYPEQFARTWEAPKVITPGVPTQALRPAQLNFNYSIDAGRQAIEPRAVYDDGNKTFIVLQERDLSRDLPAVFAEGPDGKLESVNFTPPIAGGSTYVVDRVAHKLILATGKDSKHQTTLINKAGR